MSKDFDTQKFYEEILFFRNQIAPTPRQQAYLDDCKEKILDDIGRKSEKSGHPMDRCLLVALCGELTSASSKQQQAEFATRLLLLELLIEPDE